MKKIDENKTPKKDKKNNIKLNIRITLAVFICIFSIMAGYLCYSVYTYGESWFSTPYNPRISSVKNSITPGSIYDRNGNVLAYTDEDGDRKYAESENVRRSACHIVGDDSGKTIGAETYFAKYLYGYNKGVIERLKDAIKGEGKEGSDIYLTIDKDISRYIYENMEYRGSVVLLNYETGEVLASVSAPTFDPYYTEDVDENSSAFVNRATMGRYPPGSVFKIVTLSCAIEKGIDMEYTCTGEEIIEGQRITCPKDGGHGTQNLKEAFLNSCNTYFGKLSEEIGGKAILDKANSVMFNTDFALSDFSLYKSNYENSQDKGDVAWAAIGQYNDLVTPMHTAMITAAVANDGVMCEPKILADVKYKDESTYSYNTSYIKNCFSYETASEIKEYMKGVVEEGTGTSANIDGVTVCGKTGTAEYSENGEIKNHSWFTAFIEENEHPLCVSVILEGAGYGSSHAAPLAKKVLSYAIDKGY